MTDGAKGVKKHRTYYVYSTLQVEIGDCFKPAAAVLPRSQDCVVIEREGKKTVNALKVKAEECITENNSPISGAFARNEGCYENRTIGTVFRPITSQ